MMSETVAVGYYPQAWSGASPSLGSQATGAEESHREDGSANQAGSF